MRIKLRFLYLPKILNIKGVCPDVAFFQETFIEIHIHSSGIDNEAMLR